MKSFEKELNDRVSHYRSSDKPLSVAAPSPRLVIGDPTTAASVVIAKTRAEIIGLNALLQRLTPASKRA